ncbi:MAG: TraC family protein [Desulfobacteraceae bacterium]
MITEILNYFIDKYNASINQAEVCEKDILKQIQRNRFSKYIPMRAYDPDQHCYFNVDGTIGFLWELYPVAYASASLYDNLESILNSMPKKGVFQVILYSDDDIDPILDRYLAIREQDYADLCARTAYLFKTASKSGFVNMSGIPARNFRCFAAIKVPYDEDMADELKFLRDSVYEALRGGNLAPAYCEPEQLCHWMQRLLLSEDDLPGPGVFKYNDQHYINQQILTGGATINVNFDHLTIGDKIVKVHTIKEYPRESLNNLTINQVLGGIMGATDDSNQYNFPFLVSMNIIKDDLSYKIQGKTNLSMIQEKKGASAGHKNDRQSELFWITREMDRGTTFVRVIPTIISFNKDLKSASENSARIKRMWESAGFILNNDRGILSILFLLSLPYGFYYTKTILDFLERDRIMPAKSAARLLPIQGDFTGLGDPVSIFTGRKGQLVTLDLFQKDAPNSNVIVTAKSGQGKSYLMNRILTDYRSIGAKLRVFDLGRSYQKLSTVLGGKFIEFSKDSVHCLNPFTNVRDINEDIGLLSLIISQMAWSSSGDKPSETQMSILKATIRDVWYSYGNDNVDHIDLVQLALMDFDGVLKRQNFQFDANSGEINTIARELAFNLNDFTKRNHGCFGRWFNGRSTLNIKEDPFVVFELEELKAQPELFKPVSMQVVNNTTQDLYLSNRSQRHLIVFDEAWKWFVEGSFLGDVIQEGYRVARKYFAAFITIFQSLQDLKAFGKGGEVIRENSEFKFMLKSDYNVAKHKGLIDYEEFVMKILDSVNLQKGRYSEMFIKTPFSMGVARLPSDQYTHMVFTSDPRENRIINDVAQKYNLSATQAIEFISKEYKESA